MSKSKKVSSLHFWECYYYTIVHKYTDELETDEEWHGTFPHSFFYHTGCTGSLKIHKWITQKKVDALCKKFCVIAPACFLNE